MPNSSAAAPTGSPPSRALTSGYWKLYIDHVLQADEGADLDFLRGKRGVVRAEGQPLRLVVQADQDFQHGGTEDTEGHGLTKIDLQDCIRVEYAS